MALTFYATIPAGDERPYMPAGVPVLLPASSWHRKPFRMRAPRLPEHVTERAGDSGGYVAMTRWGGEYPYTPEEYVTWLRTFSPSWAATMDFCCEEEIAANAAEVARRQERTTEMARLFWSEYAAEPWCWVPTIQGWQADDYRRHAQQLRPLLQEMREEYARLGRTSFRVGIGTLCQRTDNEDIRDIVGTIARVLGADMPLHLWGVKIAALKGKARPDGAPDALPGNVVSVDSAAWDGYFGKGCTRFHGSGMSQREYGYKVALPDYLNRFAVAVGGKQTTLWEMFE